MIVNTRADIDTRHTTIKKHATTRFELNMLADLKCAALLVFGCSSDKLQLSKWRFSTRAATSALWFFLASSWHQFWKTGFTTRIGLGAGLCVFTDAIQSFLAELLFVTERFCNKNLIQKISVLFWQSILRVDTLE